MKLVSTDWTEPFNYLVGKVDGPDSRSPSGTLSTVQYDNMVRADRPGRIYITLRNQRFQQIDVWPTDWHQELKIEFFENPANWVSAGDKCKIQ